MKIVCDSEVKAVAVEMEGAADVTMRILIGPDDGSNKIVMRLFTVSGGGHNPIPYPRLRTPCPGQGRQRRSRG